METFGNIAPVTVSVEPSYVKPDSASKVSAEPLPVIILLSALLFIVVKVTVPNDKLPPPSVLRN